MSTLPLFKVACYDRAIGLINYSDMVAYDKDHTIVALRIGGYPESVQAMSDAILGGCELELTDKRQKICVNSKGKRKYERKISHDGIYAEAMHYLLDDTLHSFTIEDIDDTGQKSELETIGSERNLYFFGNDENDLFGELNRKLSVPLIPEFKKYFLSELQLRGLLDKLQVYSVGQFIQGWCLKISWNEKEIIQVLEDGLKNGLISIPNADMNNQNIFRNIRSFTQYLKEFGSQVASRIQKNFHPRFNPAEEEISSELKEINEFVKDHAGYSLFDAQLGVAEALKRQLEKDKMALLVAECGTGKSKIGSAALYNFQKSNPLKKTYIKAFNVVICPSHLTEKWVRELYETIPDCFAQHVKSMKDIDRLYGIYLRENKTVYCILSKETARNGYMRYPAVSWNRYKQGFVCPHCGKIQKMTAFAGSSSYLENANALFFRTENSKNHKCQFCDKPLWAALNPDDLDPKRNEWVRIGGYGYIHRLFTFQALLTCKKEYRKQIEDIAKNINGIFPAIGAYRRYPLSAYLKKRVRHIDALLIDELHEYSGESAQGQAMAELAGISDKILGMTATLINGYAKGIFYLLFRLKAHLMLLDGQKYKNPREFCSQYGVVEQIFQLENDEYNVASKSTTRKIQERFLPGVSPLVYSRFLLDNSVFLSLNDMGKELPDYEEIPVPCLMQDDVKSEYERIETDFRRTMKKESNVGKRLMSVYMNLLSVYPDQPYEHKPICSPLAKEDTEPWITPKDIGDASVLQPKDEKILELVEQKIKNGERIIIYTAWTRLDTQSKIHKLFTEKGIHTAILDRKIPATKRETWVDKRVQEGVKVLIVNPALVQTGLDLIAFTTLVFYNVAFNLYIFRQAARRSWRINQTAPRVEVYMFYYKNTIQQRALRLMASKLAAAMVIEGNISDEGLAAMSDCQDLTSQLAKELVKGVKNDVENLSESFQKMAVHGNRMQKIQVREAVKVTDLTSEKNKAVILPRQNTISYKKAKGQASDTSQLSIFDLIA